MTRLPRRISCQAATGGVYAAGHERHRRAADIHGHAAIALNRVEIDQNAVMEDIQGYFQIRVFEADGRIGERLHIRAHLAVNLVGLYRKRLSERCAVMRKFLNWRAASSD